MVERSSGQYHRVFTGRPRLVHPFPSISIPTMISGRETYNTVSVLSPNSAMLKCMRHLSITMVQFKTLGNEAVVNYSSISIIVRCSRGDNCRMISTASIYTTRTLLKDGKFHIIKTSSKHACS